MLRPYFSQHHYYLACLKKLILGKNCGLGYLIFLFSPIPSILCWEDLKEELV